MTNIKLLKLVSGEEIIALIISEDEIEGDIILKHPMLIIPGPQGIVIIPWLTFAKDSESKAVYLLRQQVFMVTDPVDEIKNAYNEKYGSGIITSSKRLELPP